MTHLEIAVIKLLSSLDDKKHTTIKPLGASPKICNKTIDWRYKYLRFRQLH